MNAAFWFKTLLSMVAIAVGLTYGFYIALKHTSALPPSKRDLAMGVFMTAYLAIALILGLAVAGI